ncbi:unnamed protein product [Cochlearia groenlandica]
MNNKEIKDYDNSNFYETGAKIVGIVGAVGVVAGLLAWAGSSSDDNGPKEKMMKAPGKNGYISRKDFENNPKDYFKNLHGKK